MRTPDRSDKVKRIIDSPVQQLIALLNRLFSDMPMPRAKTKASAFSAELLGRHILDLLLACGEVNSHGLYSAAVGFFRPLEEALDYFAAVSLVAGAAEKWLAGKLKEPEDAAKLWIGRMSMSPVTGESSIDYRTRVRKTFHPFSHCDPSLAAWTLIKHEDETDPDNERVIELRVNHQHAVSSNAYRIDAYLIAHLWEILAVVEEAYKDHFDLHEALRKELKAGRRKMVEILKQNHEKGLLGTSNPLELQGLSETRPLPQIDKRLRGVWHGQWTCSGVENPIFGKLRIEGGDSWVAATLAIEHTIAKRRYKVTEHLFGSLEDNRLLLDGTSIMMKPENEQATFCLDSFELVVSEDRTQLMGKHICQLGSGDACFTKATGRK
jgi:hypothetical protein